MSCAPPTPPAAAGAAAAAAADAAYAARPPPTPPPPTPPAAAGAAADAADAAYAAYAAVPPPPTPPPTPPPPPPPPPTPPPAYAAAAAAYAARAAAAAIWRNIQIDAGAAEQTDLPGFIPGGLWRDEPPNWAQSEWVTMQSALPKNENWGVWTIWYEDRLDGRDYDEARELVYATVPDSEWKQGSKAANAWIRARLNELHPQPFANKAMPAAPTPEPPRPSPQRAPTIVKPSPPLLPMPPALWVLFSYAWQPIDAQHRAQLDLYARLTHLINQKPPEFGSLPKIELWRDVERLENSHGAEAQIAAACDRAFLLLALMSRKYPTSEGCMQEFDKFVDAKGDNCPGKQAIVVAVNCRRNEIAARFSQGLRLWLLDDEENTLVEAIARKEPAKDAFAHRIAEQIWRAAARHLGGELTNATPKLSAPKSKTGGKRKAPARERLQTFTYVPAWNELRVNESGRIGANPDAPHVNDTSAPAEKARESHEEVCRKLAEAAADSLEQGHFGVFRDDYLVVRLRKYADCVPTHNNVGNMVLANVWADHIRDDLNDHRDKWPKRCVKEVESVLAQHDKLNPAFPAAAAATAFAADAQSLPPVPEDPLADIPEAINQKPASDAFVPEVAEALSQSLAPIASPEPATLQSEAQRGPREYEILTTLNRLVRILDVGAKMNGTISLARQVLMPLIEKFLDSWMPHWPF